MTTADLTAESYFRSVTVSRAAQRLNAAEPHDITTIRIAYRNENRVALPRKSLLRLLASTYLRLTGNRLV